MVNQLTEKITHKPLRFRIFFDMYVLYNTIFTPSRETMKHFSISRGVDRFSGAIRCEQCTVRGRNSPFQVHSQFARFAKYLSCLSVAKTASICTLRQISISNRTRQLQFSPEDWFIQRFDSDGLLYLIYIYIYYIWV